MNRLSERGVLNRIQVTPWVLGTAEKMQKAGTEAVRDWNRYWLETYRELGGRSDQSGSKGCPRAAAYALRFLGRLRGGGRALRSWAVPQVNRELGKNAAYVAIAAESLTQGDAPAADRLWPFVQARYEDETGQEAAVSEQGEIKLVVALFRDNQLIRPPQGRA
jgi:hypothetical protein